MNDTQEKYTKMFLSGPILGPLVRFALPLMLSLLLQALYGGVDLAVVGQFSPTASVSAVATGSQVMQSVTVLITGLTMGVTVLLGKAVGANDAKAAGEVVSGQIRLFTIVAAALTFVMLLLAPQAAQLMNVPEEALPETVRYVRICSAGIVFITAYNGISGVFRALGNSRSPFLFVLIACLMNVALDLLFVGVFGMNAAGAALATVIAQAASVFFSLAYTRRHPLPFAIGNPLRAGRRCHTGHPARRLPHRLAGFSHQPFLSDHHQHRQRAGIDRLGGGGHRGKALCLFVHRSHGLHVRLIHLCGAKHGGREQKTL